MTETQIRLRRKPFLVLSVVLFLLCLVGLLTFFRSEPLADKRAGHILAITFSVSIAVPVAFVMCGVAQVVRAFWVGDMVAMDLVYPAIIMGICGLLVLAYALVPRVAAAVELSVLAILLAFWLWHIALRLTRRLRKRRRRIALEPRVWK